MLVLSALDDLVEGDRARVPGDLRSAQRSGVRSAAGEELPIDESSDVERARRRRRDALALGELRGCGS